MRKQILIVHGAGVQVLHRKSTDWQAGLQDALGPKYEVLTPQMPKPETPRYAGWKIRLAESLALLDDKAILVGHSLGGSVLLKYLSEETSERPISGLFIVAAPCWGADQEWQSDEFTFRKDFSSLLRIPRIVLYHSRDDEVVPFTHLAHLKEKLPTAIVSALDGRGHEFNKEAFPEIVNDIRSLVT
jgi:predicted alpha/beta hydrolase family esterase